MHSGVVTALNGHLAAHHGVVSRAQAVALGLSVRQIERALRTRELQPLYRGVYVLGGVVPSAKTRLLGACLAAGPEAVGSHRSAAWAWNLLRRSPPWPVVTVSAGRHPQLDGAVAIAIAEQLVDLAAIATELDRLSRHGRPGVKTLRASLLRRGLVEPPEPSVLESKLLRLLWSWGIIPLSAETKVAGGRYRIDVLLAEGLALEVDGFAYHSSPEAKAADSRRRNALRALGFTVVESDWVTVTRHPEQLRREILAAMALVQGTPAQ